MVTQKRTSVPVILLICCTLLFVLTGCGSSASQEEIEEDLTLRLDEITSGVTTSLGVLADGLEADEVATYGVSESELLSAFLDGFSYNIGSISVDKDNGTATANVSFTCKSYDEIIEAFEDAAFDIPLQDGADTMSDEELNALYGEALLEAIASASTGQTDEVTITYVEVDGVWEPDSDFESVLAEALLSL